MGEKNNILLVNDGIYLYSHWDTEEDLSNVLRSALIRGKNRWNDRSYLNRIIFSEMIKDEVLEETGYGLGNFMPDGQVVLSVDVDKQEVDGESFEEFIK